MTVDGQLVDGNREEQLNFATKIDPHSNMDAYSQQTSEVQPLVENVLHPGGVEPPGFLPVPDAEACPPPTQVDVNEKIDVPMVSQIAPAPPLELSGDGNEAVPEAPVSGAPESEQPLSRCNSISPGLSNVRLPLGLSPKDRAVESAASKPDAPAPTVEDAPEPIVEKRQEPKVGDVVEIIFGRGQVRKVLENGMLEVVTLGWEMALEFRPYFICSKDAVKVMPTVYYKLPVLERLQLAAWLKEEGTIRFKESDYTGAVEKYMKAVGVINTCDFKSKMHNARALELMIPCYNNSATCYIKLKQHRDSRVLAENVDSLCSTLERNRKGEVMKGLRARGASESKVLGSWWGKGLYLGGRACMYLGEYEEAVKHLRKGVRVTKAGALETLREDIAAQLEVATKRWNTQTKKAQKMWNKAFEKNSTATIPNEPTETPEALALRSVQGGAAGMAAPFDIAQKLEEMAQRQFAAVNARAEEAKETKARQEAEEEEEEEEEDEEEEEEDLSDARGWLWGTFALGVAAASLTAFIILGRRRSD